MQKESELQAGQEFETAPEVQWDKTLAEFNGATGSVGDLVVGFDSHSVILKTEEGGVQAFPPCVDEVSPAWTADVEYFSDGRAGGYEAVMTSSGVLLVSEGQVALLS